MFAATYIHHNTNLGLLVQIGNLSSSSPGEAAAASFFLCITYNEHSRHMLSLHRRMVFGAFLMRPAMIARERRGLVTGICGSPTNGILQYLFLPKGRENYI